MPQAPDQGAGLPPGSEGRTHLTQLTVGSFMPWAADALVAGDLVLAGAPMQAWLGSALINFWERSTRGAGARGDPENKAVLCH